MPTLVYLPVLALCLGATACGTTPRDLKFGAEAAFFGRVTDVVQLEKTYGGTNAIVPIGGGKVLNLYAPKFSIKGHFVLYVTSEAGTRLYVHAAEPVARNQCLSILPANGEASTASFSLGEAQVVTAPAESCRSIASVQNL